MSFHNNVCNINVRGGDDLAKRNNNIKLIQFHAHPGGKYVVLYVILPKYFYTRDLYGKIVGCPGARIRV